MKSISQYIFNKLSIAFLITGFLFLGSCKDELITPDISFEPLGEDEFIVSVPVSFDEAEIRTRAMFAKGGDNVNIENIWVGIFNADSHKLVGSAFDEEGVLVTNLNHSNVATSIDVKCVGFSEVGTTRYYIAGVANFKNILGYKAGETVASDMSSLLASLTSWDEYISLIADVESVEAKTKGDNPFIFMSGIWSVGHENATVNSEGVLAGNNGTNMYVEFTPNYDSGDQNYYKPFVVQDGNIHLRPLVTHASVTVTFNSDLEVSDFRWQLCNIPNYTFVQERTTEPEMGTKSGADYLKITPAASDWFEDGYSISDDYFVGMDITPEQLTVFDIQDSDKVSNNGNEYTFGFWHYDNKHWGVSSCNTYAKREAGKINSEGVKIYNSLCDEANNGLNNNASYFIIKAHIKDKNGLEGDTRFLIHEGFACTENGSTTTDIPSASRDFSAFRNTDYTYNIKINGLSDIVVKVYAEDGITNPDANPGATGHIYGEIDEVFVRNAGTSYAIEMSAGDKLNWCVVTDNSYFGQFDNDKIEEAVEGLTKTESFDNDFYKSLKIKMKDGFVEYPFADFVALADGEYEIIFPVNSEMDTRSVFIATSLVSEDKMTSYNSVFKFTQDGSKLDQPLVTMPAVKGSSLVVGLDDHTLEIEPVMGADTYTFTVTGPEMTYTEIRSIITPEQYNIVSSVKGSFSGTEDDNNGDPVRFRKVEKNGKEVYLYSVFYGNSRGGLMYNDLKSGSNYTFSVEASDSKGMLKPSPDISISKSIIRPEWTFNVAPWTDITKGTNLAANLSWSYNGLTVATGDNTMQFREVSNSYGYAFNTGGAGFYHSHDDYRRVFMFHAVTSGKVVTVASNTTGSNAAGRYMKAWANNEEQTSKIDSGTGTDENKPGYQSPATSNDFTDMTPDFNVPVDIENYVVYSGANLNVYKITFTPTGNSRPFHKGVDD